MIIGIGCDIVEHEMSKALNWESNPSSLARIFSKPEIDNCPSEVQLRFLSGRFAAKEAVLKCLGIGMQDGISFTDIEILKLVTGKPQVALMGQVKKVSEGLGINFWHISITHTENMSFAVVIAERV